MKMQTMTVGPAAREVHYYRAGEGEPLLYLHHLMGSVGAEPALATLAERFDVMAGVPASQFPGGTLLRWPGLVAGMLFYSLRDRIG